MKFPPPFKLGRSRGQGPRVPTDPAIRAFRLERRKARLRVIPTLFTLANAGCGFAAIVQVASLQFDAKTMTIVNHENLVVAALLILLAMVFDALDGRVARMTETTGDFGGELDSLCDAISFGVAPALMTAMVNARAITDPTLSKIAWVFGLAFACGAILRLARFNVENTHDEEAHLSFKGLPSPAAAGTIISSILFMEFLREQGFDDAARFIGRALPFVALAAGYLMVSTLRYVHLPNRYLRGRKSVRRIAQIFFGAVILFALFPYIGLFLAFTGFAFSGPVARVLELTGLRVPASAAAAATTLSADGVRPAGSPAGGATPATTASSGAAVARVEGAQGAGATEPGASAPGAVSGSGAKPSGPAPAA